MWKRPIRRGLDRDHFYQAISVYIRTVGNKAQKATTRVPHGTLELYPVWSVLTMGVTVDGKAAVVFENPLVPNRVLREMYKKLIEARIVAERESKPGKRSRPTNQHEACRVSMTQGLSEGDLVMDSQPGGVMKFLLGMKLAVAFPAPEKKIGKTAARKTKPSATRVLPFVEDAEARLYAGLGTAMLQKKSKGTDLTVIFVQQSEVSADAWRRALTLAAANKLPVIFVALPDTKGDQLKAKATDRPSAIALRCGLPGIPVEATDVVALYRVAQEAIGRIRIGGGAVVIEGISFRLHGKPEPGLIDPVLQLGEALLRRHAATQAWLSSTEKSFLRRIGTHQKS